MLRIDVDAVLTPCCLSLPAAVGDAEASGLGGMASSGPLRDVTRRLGRDHMPEESPRYRSGERKHDSRAAEPQGAASIRGIDFWGCRFRPRELAQGIVRREVAFEQKGRMFTT